MKATPFNLDSATIENWNFQKVIKKPIIVHASQINLPEGFEVTTLEGKMTGKPGDYLMVGINGEKYICDKDIFEQTYEFVDLPCKEVKQQSQRTPTPAPVGNKVSTGLGDLFGGTSWGNK